MTFPNGAPAPNEQIEITARNYQNAHRFSRNFTSDQAGIVHFGLPTQDVATFYINVSSSFFSSIFVYLDCNCLISLYICIYIYIYTYTYTYTYTYIYSETSKE